MPPQQKRMLSAPIARQERRYTYIKQAYTIAGPGAYVIPSTFRRRATNTLLREVQRQQYGRDFARMKRNGASQDVAPTDASCGGDCDERAQSSNVACQHRGVTGDKYRERRDHLRRQVQLEPSAGGWKSPTPSCYDAYVDGYGSPRRSQSTCSAGEGTTRPPPTPTPTAWRDDSRAGPSNDTARRATAADAGSYDQYLATTSYLTRMLRLRQARS